MRAKKSYEEGGRVYERAVGRKAGRKLRKAKAKAVKAKAKVVAQGAEKKDIRREKKQDRMMKRNETKRYVEKGSFDVGVDGRTERVEGKLVTKRKSGEGAVTKFKAKGTGAVKAIKDKKKTVANKAGELVVKKEKKSTKYNPAYEKKK